MRTLLISVIRSIPEDTPEFIPGWPVSTWRGGSDAYLKR